MSSVTPYVNASGVAASKLDLTSSNPAASSIMEHQPIPSSNLTLSDLGSDELEDDLPLSDSITLAASGVRGVPGRKINRPAKKDMCMSIEDGHPANFHYDDADQFVMMDGGVCKPVLSLVDNSCSAHMDIGTRCGSYCQTSMFHSFGTPVDLQHGSMCREGENCEMKYEHSKSLQISNKVVDRHVKDTTISVTPGAAWGYGLKDVTIPLPNIGGGRVRRDLAIKENNRRQLAADKPLHTGYETVDAVLARMFEQDQAEAAGTLFADHASPIGQYDLFDEEADNSTAIEDVTEEEHPGPFMNFAGWFKNIFRGKGRGNAASAAGGAPQQKASIDLPLPTITSPTGSLSATFTRNWLHESVHTHYRASQTGEFTSLTHKQVPGDGCGSFYLVPTQITTCGWQALPRVPAHMQEDVLNWLASASLDEIHQSDFKRGVWSADGSHKKNGRYQKQMWQIGPGGCPASYFEFPTCTNSYAKNADGTAMGRVTYVKRDCDTGRILDMALQPRAYSEAINFDDIFHEHLLKDPRLFNLGLGHLPPLSKGSDVSSDGEDLDN